MQEKGNWLAVIFVWLVIIGVIALLGFGWKYYFKPKQHEKLQTVTGSESQYKKEVTLYLDGFSGYSIIRSEHFSQQLKNLGVRLNVQDDLANYEERINAIKSGDAQLAVFTIDSLLKTGITLGEVPGSIVLVIDESKGADAIIAWPSVKNLEALNDPSARFVLTPNSPSEFLVRACLADFDFSALPENPWTEANGAEEVFKQFKSADQSALRAYVMWEPFVTMAKQAGGTVLLDSSRTQGYIMDVLVVERKFLAENSELVQQMVEAYLRSLYHYETQSKMEKLILDDAKAGGIKLDEAQVKALVSGIRFKSTQENYAHFGLPGFNSAEHRHLEDAISRIGSVLIRTKAVQSNSFIGKENTLFYDGIMRKMLAESFHPGQKVGIIKDSSQTLEALPQAIVLPALTDEQWQALHSVANLKIEPISFYRGKSDLNVAAKQALRELSKKLESWPTYYITIVGHAQTRGNIDLNLELAKERARTTLAYLDSMGINTNRLRAISIPPQEGGSQTVTFELGEQPY